MMEVRKVTELPYTEINRFGFTFHTENGKYAIGNLSVELTYKAVEDFQISAITTCMWPLFKNHYIELDP